MTDPDLHRFPGTPNLMVCVDSSCNIVLQVGGLSTTYQRITISNVYEFKQALDAAQTYAAIEFERLTT